MRVKSILLISLSLVWTAVGAAIPSASSEAFSFSPSGMAAATSSSDGFAFVTAGSAVASDSSSPCAYAPAGTVLTSAASEPFAFGERTEEMILRTAFDGVGIVSRAGDGHLVTVTNDFVGTIRLPDNIGSVEIDLAGHGLTGEDGEGGTETSAGSDGTPAVVVVAASEDGLATQLVLSNSDLDRLSVLLGGYGGDGAPAGNGGVAVRVEPLVREGAGVTIGVAVATYGGKGGLDLSGSGTGGLTADAVDGPDDVFSKVVQFDAAGGAPAFETLAEVVGRTYVLPAKPVREGHDFVGWRSGRPGGFEVDASTLVCAEDGDTLYAQWKAVVSRVSLGDGLDASDYGNGEWGIVGSGVLTAEQTAKLKGQDVRNLTILSGVTAIGDQAFEGWSSLREVTIGKSCTALGDKTFHKCYGVTNVTCEAEGLVVGDYAFLRCNSLRTLTFASMPEYGEMPFAFHAEISMKDGMPEVFSVPKVIIGGYRQVLRGSNDLKEWHDVTSVDQRQNYHFFKIELRAE